LINEKCTKAQYILNSLLNGKLHESVSAYHLDMIVKLLNERVDGIDTCTAVAGEVNVPDCSFVRLVKSLCHFVRVRGLTCLVVHPPPLVRLEENDIFVITDDLEILIPTEEKERDVKRNVGEEKANGIDDPATSGGARARRA